MSAGPHGRGREGAGQTVRPPRLARALVLRATPERDREVMLGDLEEELVALARRHGVAEARRWYWRQALRSVPPGVMRRLRRRPGRRDRTTGDGPMSSFWQDLRFTLREYLRTPAFALTVVATLALGIAATTVIFSAVDGVVLRPFDFPRPERLVGIGPEYPRLDQELSFWEVLSPAEFVDLREQSRTLERIVAWDMGHRELSGEDASERVFSAFWWGDVFATLGVEPALGRGFSDREIEERAAVAVLSHRLWQRRFGGDEAIVGDVVLVNGEPYEVIGVMPERTLIYGTDLWLPMPIGPEAYARNRRQFQVLARLGDGVTMAQVQSELDTIARRIEAEHVAELEEYTDWRLRAMTWNKINVRLLEPLAWTLMATVGFVLLLVCVNVANLMLGRSARRQHELAVRRALGAGRGRLVRQMLTEAIVLAGIGGVLGVALSHLGLRAVERGIASFGVPIPGSLELNGRVLAVAAAATLASGLLFGLAPALQASRQRSGEGLREEGVRGGTSRRRRRSQRVFVAVEVALALMLVFGGTLLLGGFLRLQRVEPGFTATDLLTLRITLPWERYDRQGMSDFFAELDRRLEERPGVESAALASQLPPQLFSRDRFHLQGRPPAEEGSLPWAFATAVSPDYFRTLGIPLLRGRVFESGDGPEAPPVAVVNQTLAEHYFPGVDPLGQRLRLDRMPDGPWFTIVGVVGDTRNVGPERPPAPELFGSVEQGLGANQLFVAVRSAVPPASLAAVIRDTVRELDPEQSIYAVQSMTEAYARTTAPRRFATGLLLFFGAFALLLAGVGIHAVVSASVWDRTQEIGVRMALGAEAGRVRRWIVATAMVPVAIGAVVGIAGAFGVGRVLSAVTPDLGGLDPLALVAALSTLVAVALAASGVPAWRASRLDPVRVLRED